MVPTSTFVTWRERHVCSTRHGVGAFTGLVVAAVGGVLATASAAAATDGPSPLLTGRAGAARMEWWVTR